MGPGKADLLDAIAATGSISAAAKHMGMSYRRAWLLVDTMNRCFERPLVATHPGGGGNAGAEVTAAGQEALRDYRTLAEEVGAAASGAAHDRLESAIRPLPR
jgi:molybdate transport system regulatory protein